MTGRRIYANTVRGAAAVAAISAASFGAPISAEVIETSTISSSYFYRVGSQQGSGSEPTGGDRLLFRDEGEGFESEGGVSLEATLDDGSFFFLHDGFCVGDCEIVMSTDVVFTLFNSGTEAVNLRFDSLITPGHLARSSFFESTNGGGSFRFRVEQSSGPTTASRYSAQGNVSNGPINLATSNGILFNGYTEISNDPDFSVTDWSATNLNVNLATIGPGATSTVVYHSDLLIRTLIPDCEDVRLCEGFQVAFGDPRTLGGATRSLAASSAVSRFAEPVVSALAMPFYPAVGAIYDPFRVTYSFVPIGSPLPPQPPVLDARPYTVGYRPFVEVGGAVPEPATWAMMLIGFAAVGRTTRSRRKARPSHA